MLSPGQIEVLRLAARPRVEIPNRLWSSAQTCERHGFVFLFFGQGKPGRVALRAKLLSKGEIALAALDAAAVPTRTARRTKRSKAG